VESLAAMVAVIVTVVWGVGLVAAGLSFGGLRVLGGCVGIAGIVLACGMAFSVPHAWLMWTPPLIASLWAAWRLPIVVS
jgi:hypothetical protein